MQSPSSLSLSRRTGLAFCIVGYYWGAIAAQFPVIKQRIGADDGLFGLLLLATSLGLFTTMFLAPMLDRALGRWAMPVAALALASAFLLPGLAQTPAMFFFAMSMAGLGSGLADVTMNARVSDLEAKHGRSLMNLNHGMFSVGYCLSALATGFAREAGLTPFTVFSLLFMLTLCLLPFLRIASEAPQSDDTHTSAPFPHAVIAICGAIVLIAFMGEASVESWSALHIERTLGGRAAEGALGPAMLGMMMALGRFAGAAVSAKINDRTLIAYAAILAALGALLAAIAPTPLIAYFGFGTIGLGVSVIGPLGLAIVGRLVTPQQRVKAIARTAVIGFSGFFIAPAIMGVISDAYGLRIAFASVAALVLLTLPILPLARNLERRQKSSAPKKLK